MKYTYEDPTEQGFEKVSLSKQDHNDLFPHDKRTWTNRFEYYLNDDTFKMHKLYSRTAVAIQLILFPIVLIGEGIFNFKEVVNDYKRMIRQKKHGAFVPYCIYKRHTAFDEIRKKLHR